MSYNSPQLARLRGRGDTHVNVKTKPLEVSRRRGKALVRPTAASPHRLKANSLKDVEEMLQYIPRVYQSETFNVSQRTMRLIDAGDPIGSMEDLQVYCDQVEEACRVVATTFEVDFNTALTKFSDLCAQARPGHDISSRCYASLVAASKALVPKGTELQSRFDELEELEARGKLLSRIEDLLQTPDLVQKYYASKHWRHASALLVKSVSNSFDEELMAVEALSPLRKSLLDERNRLPEVLLHELKSLLYLSNPLITEMGLARDNIWIQTQFHSSSTTGSRRDRRTPTKKKKPQKKHRRGRSLHVSVDDLLKGNKEIVKANEKVVDEEEELSVDYSRQLPSYVKNIVMSLNTLNKLGSSMAELVNTADINHTMSVIDALVVGEEGETVDTLIVAVCRDMLGVMRGHVFLGTVLHTLDGNRVSPLARLWASAQDSICVLLQDILQDTAVPSKVESVMSAAESAGDNTGPLFSFSNSSAAHVNSSSSLSSSKTTTTHQLQFGASPYHLITLFAPLKTLFEQVCSLHEELSESPPVLLEWLKKFGENWFVPQLKIDQASLIAAADGSQLRSLNQSYSANELSRPLLEPAVVLSDCSVTILDILCSLPSLAPNLVSVVSYLASEFHAKCSRDLEKLLRDSDTLFRLQSESFVSLMLNDTNFPLEPSDDQSAAAPRSQQTSAYSELQMSSEKELMNGSKRLRAENVLMNSRDFRALAQISDTSAWLSGKFQELSGEHGDLQVAYQMFHELAARALIALRVEVRHHCFYRTGHMQSDGYHAEGALEEDRFVRDLCAKLVEIHEVLLGYLPLPHVRYIFVGVGSLVAQLLIRSTEKRIVRVDPGGAHKMALNALIVQQRLGGGAIIDADDERKLDLVSAYYELASMSFDQVLGKLSEGLGQAFTSAEYMAMFKISVQHQGELNVHDCEKLDRAIEQWKNINSKLM